MSNAYRKKLIEVALPLEAINKEAAREKSIRHGHPTSIHLWWARRPLAACRAILFASLVDDPASRPEVFASDEEQETERQRLFRLMEELVKWENSDNETVLRAAHEEIVKATDGELPYVLDPFCGGGSIPLEAQRLGLRAYASDLNPVAVLLTKALIEIPPRFSNAPPENPVSRAKLGHGASWNGAQGLAEDVRYYGNWMRDRASERIGDLYPQVTDVKGKEMTTIAWIWARTVRCPNPACGIQMPLVRSWALSTRRGKEAHVQPSLDGGVVRYEVCGGSGVVEGTVGRRGAVCIACSTAVSLEYVREEGQAGRLGQELIAIVGGGARGRSYLSPAEEHENAAASVPAPDDALDAELSTHPQYMGTPRYGLTRHRDLFTARQLVALSTFSDLVSEARTEMRRDGIDNDYADALATYLALGVSKCADYNTQLVVWSQSRDQAKGTFARQALPMVWDFAEVNPFARAAGDFAVTLSGIADVIERLPATRDASVVQLDATAALENIKRPMTCTDPPYYDNVPYSDLADFFYVLLRRTLGGIYPDLFSTLLTPKTQELVADVSRFGGDRKAAREFFEDGMRRVFEHIRDAADPRFPTSIFYAFRQAESEPDGATVSTGWDTMLTGMLNSGLAITGTWPMRSERGGRTRDIGSNALASSIILVCRPRALDAAVTTRRDLASALRAELPAALRDLQRGNVAPVDLAQAAIGPGMAIFSRYAKVLEADGSSMSVRTALGLINQALDQILAEQEGDFDPDTRFAVAWFAQRGTTEGQFGEADVLARAKNVSVGGLVDAGLFESHAGRVRLLGRQELRPDWDPATDSRLTVWEVTQHLVKRLEDGGESAAADLLRRVGGLGETARELAYRLYTICERKAWAQEALGYNALVVSWPEIARLAAEQTTGPVQQTLGV